MSYYNRYSERLRGGVGELEEWEGWRSGRVGGVGVLEEEEE